MEASAVEPSLTYLRPEVLKLKRRLDDFINDEVIPAENDYHSHMKDRYGYDSGSDRWSIDAIPPCLYRLQSRAKELGLWNLFLPPRLLKSPYWDAQILGPVSSLNPLLCPSIVGGLTYREYGILAESMGRSIELGPMACNCEAPNTGNMEVLLEFGTLAQKQLYLKPLLEGTIRSTFLMTEPDVASSDPTNLQTVLMKRKNINAQNKDAKNNDVLLYTLRGRKWWSTGAMDPRCRIGICVAKIVEDNDHGDDGARSNENDNNLHGKHTIVLVPLPHPNVKMIRPLKVFGYDDFIRAE